MSSSSASTAALPDAVCAVLELFDGPLADVRFPDIDRDILHEGRAEVEARRATLQAALEAVAAAREQLEQAQRGLFEQVRRAHAYASVFAEHDESLRAQLAEVKLDGRALAPRKKRGRPRKGAATKRQTSLAVADDAA